MTVQCRFTYCTNSITITYSPHTFPIQQYHCVKLTVYTFASFISPWQRLFATLYPVFNELGIIDFVSMFYDDSPILQWALF